MVNFTDEKHLLIDLKDGSFQAFERLYNMYSGKLYNFIMRLSSGNQYMAEEVVQSTFIRIWEVREKVDTNASFISFLCTIAKNLLMNMYQRQTVEYVYNEYLLKSSVDRDSQTEENIDLHLLNDYIDSLAEELPAQRKKIFILSKRQNYTNKEIAEMIYERHEFLSNWLISLGVPRETATEDACKIEHVISKESFEAIKKFVNE